MSDQLADAVAHGVTIYDLARPLYNGMPQSPNHPRYLHALPRRHGDMTRSDGSSAANDLIVMGTHVGTHIDALAHASFDGGLHGGVPVEEAMAGGRFTSHGIDTVSPMVRGGILLDIPPVLGCEQCEAGYEVTVDDLLAAQARAKVEIRGGDVVLIRTGWGRRFTEDPESYAGLQSGVPGVSVNGARWLISEGIYAAGGDTIAFERLAPGAGHGQLPVHRMLLVEEGVYIIEALNLEELAAAGVHQFTFILIPMPIVGGTGSPVRPLAVVSNA